MNLSETEIRSLNGIGGDELRGNNWQPVPDSCPPHIARKIAEKRAKTLGYQPGTLVETRNDDLRSAREQFCF